MMEATMKAKLSLGIEDGRQARRTEIWKSHSRFLRSTSFLSRSGCEGIL